MLTGKDIHAAKMQHEPGAKTWEELHTYMRMGYDTVAEKLNVSYIAPLQGQVAGLEEQNEKLTTDIKVLRDLDRKIFDDQEKQIDALQGVVKDYQKSFAEYILMVAPNLSTYACDYATFANWKERKDALEVRAQSLLEKEQ